MSIGLDEVVEASAGGRAQRRAKDFDPATRGGPCESRRDGDDWLEQHWGETTRERWRRVDKDLWEVAE